MCRPLESGPHGLMCASCIDAHMSPASRHLGPVLRPPTNKTRFTETRKVSRTSSRSGDTPRAFVEHVMPQFLTGGAPKR